MPEFLLATDSDRVFDEIASALGDEETRVSRVADGRWLLDAVREINPDLVICDLQIGSMGGMAACRDLRLESGSGRLARQRVLLLVDRAADEFLAKQADADGWLVKPLDSFRLQRAARIVAEGGSYSETLAGKAGHGARNSTI